MGQEQTKQQHQNSTLLKDNTNIPNASYTNNNMKKFNEIDFLNLQKQKFQEQSISYSTSNKENNDDFRLLESPETLSNITIAPNQEKKNKVLK